MTYLRTVAAWPASWLLYGFGDLIYKFLDAIDVPLTQETAVAEPPLSRFERARLIFVGLLYPLYNLSMIGSSAVQTWGGDKGGPWEGVPTLTDELSDATITEEDVANDNVPAEVEPRV